jgi:hypothetical protein
LEHGRERPPPHGEDEHEGVGSLDPGLLAPHVFRHRLVLELGIVLVPQQWVETLGVEIGDFDGVPGGAHTPHRAVQYESSEGVRPGVSVDGQHVPGRLGGAGSCVSGGHNALLGCSGHSIPRQEGRPLLGCGWSVADASIAGSACATTGRTGRRTFRSRVRCHVSVWENLEV